MLQPLQLRDVSARHEREIAELRDFFEKADCVLGTRDSLHAIADRVQRDRGFHRDLKSHLWVVIDSCKGEIGYADLLGVLAIAGAGMQFAAEADEDDAHALLRFVMEARHSLDGADEGKNAAALAPVALHASPSRAVSAARIVPAQVGGEEVMLRPFPVERLSVSSSSSSLGAEERGGSRRRFLWVAAGVLVALCAVSAGLVLHFRSGGEKVGPVIPAAVGPVAAPVVSSEGAAVSPAGDVGSAAGSAAVEPSSAASGSAMPAAHEGRMGGASTARSLRRPVVPAAANAVPSVAVRPTAPPAAVASAPVVSSPPPAAPSSAAAVAHAAPAPVATGRSAQPAAAGPPGVHLGLGANAPDASTADFSNTVRQHYTPRLLRRTPAEQQELAAAARPADIAAAKASSPAAAEAVRGTVSANSLGVHAANVIYSPIPAYPPAASAAHVQGEVKLQTEVGRDGNIVSVRVISGPPLLREAALDAAQRWRYRADMIGGQPVPISAITVFEFQLP